MALNDGKIVVKSEQTKNRGDEKTEEPQTDGFFGLVYILTV